MSHADFPEKTLVGFGYLWFNKGVGRLFRIPVELANNRNRQTCEKCDYEKCKNLFKAPIFVKYDLITIDLIFFLDIGNLQNLEVLDLSANLFQQLPVEITRLRKLSEIILNDNLHLRTLPNTLFLLPKLQCICADSK